MLEKEISKSNIKRSKQEANRSNREANNQRMPTKNKTQTQTEMLTIVGNGINSIKKDS